MRQFFGSVAIALLLAIGSSANASTVVVYSNDGSTTFPFNTTSVADPFGTGMGDVLSVDNDFTTGGGSFINVNTGPLNLTGLEGAQWTLTYDIYSHIDIDDNVFASVQGDLQGSGGATTGSLFYGLDGQGTWLTHTQTGTFANTFTGNSRILFVSNTAGTTVVDEGEILPRYYLDNITLTTVTVVPEPNSLALLGLAGFGFMTRRRRR